MIYGLEEYYNGLIAEARTPEEIKRVLEYQFVSGKGIPQDVLDVVFDMDPTKKKSFTRWALSQWENYSNDILKAVQNGKLQKVFNYFKERANELNLGKYDFEEAMKMLPFSIEEDEVLKKTDNPEDPANDFDIVFQSPEWIIAVPHTYEADKKLGEGCRWCTAGAFRDDDYYWRDYSRFGPLWVNFDLREGERGPKNGKEYPYTRYQFLFEFDNFCGQMMDANDRPIDGVEIKIPDDAVEFYRTQNEKYVRTLFGGRTPEEIQNGAVFMQEREADARVLCERPLLRIMVGHDEHTDDWHLLPENERTYYIFGEDATDPLFNFSVKKDMEFSKIEPIYFVFKIKTDPDSYYVFSMDDDGYIIDYWNNVTSIFEFNYGTVMLANEGGVCVIIPKDAYYSDDFLEMNIQASSIRTDMLESTGDLYIEYRNVAPFSFGFKKPWHRLTKYDDSYGDFISIIHCDSPLNGEYFEIDENGIINAEILTYDTNEEANWQVERPLYTYGNFFEVCYNNSHGVRNVYDVENKKLMFRNNLSIVRTTSIKGLISVRDMDGKEFLFVPDLGKAITPKCRNIQNSNHNGGIFSLVSDIGHYKNVLVSKEFKVIPYSRLIMGFKDYDVFSDENKKIMITSTNDNEKVTTLNVFESDVDSIKDDEKYIYIVLKDGSSYLFNRATRKVTRNVPQQSPNEINENFYKILNRINNPFKGGIYG